MGVGMVIVCSKENAPSVTNLNNPCYQIGEVIAGDRTVVIE